MKTSNSRNMISIVGVFIIILVTIQYLRVEKPEAVLLGQVQTYVVELCAGVLDTKTATIVTSQQRADSISFTKQVRGAQPDFGVTVAVNTRKLDNSKFINGLIRTSAIWFIFFILSVIGWLSYASSCCCPNKCPCCDKCRRDVTKQPYSKTELLVPSIFAIFFSLVIIALGITGLIYSPFVASGIQSMRCSFMASFSDILLPANQTVFPGIDGLVERLLWLKGNLSDFQVTTNKTFSNQSNPLKTKSDKVTTDLENYAVSIMYANPAEASYYANTENLYSFMTKAENIQIGSDALKLQQTPTAEHQFLSAYYDQMQKLMKGIESATQPFISGTDFSSALNVGIAAGRNMSDSIQNESMSLYTFTKPMQTYTKGITQGLNIVFALSIVSGSLIVIGVLVLQIFKKIQARIMVQLGWCIYCIIMIIGFLLGAVLNPVSVISLEFCDYLDGFLHNQAFFVSSSLIADGQPKNILEECFFKQGDILKLMNMTQPIAQLQNLVKGIDAFGATLSNLSLASYQVKVATVINTDTTILTDMSEGTYTDENPKNSNVNGQITSFNNQKSQTGCIELAQITCSDKTIPSRTDPTSACWHPVLLVKKGTSYNYCSQQTTLAQQLISWFGQQKSPWYAFVTNQQQTLKAHTAVDGLYQAYITSLKTYVTNTDVFVAQISDPKTGLISNINCQPLQAVFARIYDAMCVLFVPAAYRNTILIIMVSISMFMGSFSSFCVGLRFYRMSLLPQEQTDKPKQSQVEEQEKQNDEKSKFIPDGQIPQQTVELQNKNEELNQNQNQDQGPNQDQSQAPTQQQQQQQQQSKYLYAAQPQSQQPRSQSQIQHNQSQQPGNNQDEPIQPEEPIKHAQIDHKQN